MMVVPAQLVALLRCPHFDPARLTSLECVLSLGAPLLKRDKDRFNAALPGRLYELYGLTEGFITILDRHDAVRKAGSVGVPPPFFHVRVVRDDGSEAAPGEVGEILGHGPITMSGYYKRPDLTAQALRDGWIHSGDLGYLDADGYLYLVDRKKDMIDSGGVKVYPRDIEEVVAAHPDVREVAVFGVPDDKWGETPLAAVILRDDAQVDPADTARVDQRARGGALPARGGGHRHDGVPAQCGGQDAQARAARALLGRQRTQALTSGRRARARLARQRIRPKLREPVSAEPRPPELCLRCCPAPFRGWPDCG